MAKRANDSDPCDRAATRAKLAENVVTRTWVVPEHLSRQELLRHEGLQAAAALLTAGSVVAFPTETVYGLGGDCTNDEAIASIYRAKGRPSDNPLIAHVCSVQQVEELAATIHPVARSLMDTFWPGPLTLVLPARKGKLSSGCTAGLETVAIRMPNHPVALALIEASGCAVAAPSANTSGRPSPTTAAHVSEDLYGKVSGLIDGGPTGVGLESTVIDCATLIADGKLPLLRPGGVTRRMIEDALRKTHPEFQVLAEARSCDDEKAAPRAPGMKYTHYAPRATLHVVAGDCTFLRETAQTTRAAGKRVGIICCEEDVELLEGAADVLLPCGRHSEPESVAARLFAVLREFDSFLGLDAIDEIFCQDFSDVGEIGGLRDAITNRLQKAAGGSVVQQGSSS